MTERKGAKTLQSVAAFHCKLRKLLERKQRAQVLEQNRLVIGSEIWYVFDFS